MTLTLPKTCSMGGSNTGLVGTIGVTLLNPDGTVHTARATAGIYEIGGGCYGKEMTFPDNWSGSIKWDTGGGSPVYATEDYDVEGLIDMIEEDTSKMNFTGTDIKATLDAEKVALTVLTQAQIDNIETDLNTPDQYKADVSALALEATLTAMKGATFAEATDSLEAIRNRGDIAWITATGFSVPNEYDVVLAAIQADLDNPAQYKATGFSAHTPADIWVAANRALSTPADYKADISTLALEDGGRVQNIEADTNEMQSKLPNDKIAGSSDATSLENKHGTGSWEGTTPTDVADAVDTKLSAEHGSGSWMGKVFVPLIKRLK